MAELQCNQVERYRAVLNVSVVNDNRGTMLVDENVDTVKFAMNSTPPDLHRTSFKFVDPIQ